MGPNAVTPKEGEKRGAKVGLDEEHKNTVRVYFSSFHADIFLFVRA